MNLISDFNSFSCTNIAYIYINILYIYIKPPLLCSLYAVICLFLRHQGQFLIIALAV